MVIANRFINLEIKNIESIFGIFKIKIPRCQNEVSVKSVRFEKFLNARSPDFEPDFVIMTDSN